LEKNSTTYTDQELLRGIKARDPDVLKFINREYRPPIRLMIRQMGGSWDDAKDIFHDGILELIRKSEDPSFQLTSSIKTLIYAICKNLWKYKSRMNHRMVALHPDQHDGVEVPAFEEATDLGLYDKLFWGNFKLLPKTCREVLALHLKNLRNSEIARLLNMTEAYVRKRKSDCTRQMIQAIRKTSEYHKLMGLSKTSLLIKNRYAR
jgi:RNA polymerase sigma factor (sigma-70 family)